MTPRPPRPRATSSDVEVRIYHLGVLKLRQSCRRAEARRIARMWDGVPGMHTRVVEP